MVPDDALVVRGGKNLPADLLRGHEDEIMSTPRVFADFHNADERGRVRLNCVGTLQDLNAHKIQLTPGLVLTLYSEEIETKGTVEYSDLEHLWVASVDWPAIFGGLPNGSDGAARIGEKRTSN